MSGNHRQFPEILAALCSMEFCTMKHQASPKRLLKTKQPTSFCPCCNLHWSAACNSGLTGLTQHYISDVLTIVSWLYTLQLSLSGLSQPFRTLLPNTCSGWSKDKLCLQLLRLSKNQFFSSSYTLIWHSYFLWKAQLSISREDYDWNVVPLKYSNMNKEVCKRSSICLKPQNIISSLLHFPGDYFIYQHRQRKNGICAFFSCLIKNQVENSNVAVTTAGMDVNYPSVDFIYLHKNGSQTKLLGANCQFSATYCCCWIQVQVPENLKFHICRTKLISPTCCWPNSTSRCKR